MNEIAAKSPKRRGRPHWSGTSPASLTARSPVADEGDNGASDQPTPRPSWRRPPAGRPRPGLLSRWQRGRECPPRPEGTIATRRKDRGARARHRKPDGWPRRTQRRAGSKASWSDAALQRPGASDKTGPQRRDTSGQQHRRLGLGVAGSASFRPSAPRVSSPDRRRLTPNGRTACGSRGRGRARTASWPAEPRSSPVSRPFATPRHRAHAPKSAPRAGRQRGTGSSASAASRLSQSPRRARAPSRGVAVQGRAGSRGR